MSKFKALLSWLAKYNKSLVALVGLLAVVVKVTADGTITGDEWQALGASFVVLAGVFGIANKKAKKA